MQNKEKVLVKGRIVKMNDAAFKIASKHFGARRNKVEDDVVPFELGKLPKLDIITALKQIPKAEVKAVEAKPLELSQKKLPRKK